MWPSGSNPLGKRDRSTNSGNVSSSRDSVKRVPLQLLLAQILERRSSSKDTEGQALCAHPHQHLQTTMRQHPRHDITRSTDAQTALCCSPSIAAYIPPSVLIGGPPPCCTCVIMLAAPPAAITYVKESSGLDPSVYGGGGSPSSALLLGHSPLYLQVALPWSRLQLSLGRLMKMCFGARMAV
jgi:hypothetical protein